MTKTVFRLWLLFLLVTPLRSCVFSYTLTPFCTRFSVVVFFSILRAVEGSASWRIPLGVQLIPGITLAIGSVFLPPSPRLLVAQGRNDEALRTLARLRLRSEHEVQDDPLLQVRHPVFCYLHPFPLCCVPRSCFWRFRDAAFS